MRAKLVVPYWGVPDTAVPLSVTTARRRSRLEPTGTVWLKLHELASDEFVVVATRWMMDGIAEALA